MRQKLIVGVDVGASKINAGLISADGRVIERFMLPTEASKGPSTIMKNVERAIEAVWAPGVGSIGVGMAGVVDRKNGIYRQGPNFPRTFRNVRVADLLKKKFGVRAIIDNDVHCFTLAESRVGAGKGLGSVVGVTLGTGIGGGIALEGRLYRGRDNAAGEIGHMKISGEDAPPCGCGVRGHFESLASGSAMAKLYEEKTGRKTVATEIERLAAAGDRNAQDVILTAANAFATGMANIIHVLNPDIIVVGGGLARLKALWPLMRKALKGMIVYPELRTTPVVRSAMGNDANIIGAALLSRADMK